MGMAAILVNGPQPFYQSSISLPQGGSKWNLSNIGPEAPEEKSFEILNIFSHTNPQGSELDLVVKRSNVNVSPLF